MTETTTNTREAPVTTDRTRLESRLRAAGERYQTADRAAKAIRAEFKELVWDATRAGLNEVEIGRFSGVARQTVRNLLGKTPYATTTQLRAAAKAIRARPMPSRTREQFEAELSRLGERYLTQLAEHREATQERKAAGMAALDAGITIGEVQRIGQVGNKALHGWTGDYDYAAHRREDRRAKATQAARRRRK